MKLRRFNASIVNDVLDLNKNIEKLEKLKIGRFALKGRVQYSRNHEAVTLVALSPTVFV